MVQTPIAGNAAVPGAMPPTGDRARALIVQPVTAGVVAVVLEPDAGAAAGRVPPPF
jgi:hypothetical protein